MAYTTKVIAEVLAVGATEFDIDIYCPFQPDIITFSNLTATIEIGGAADDNVYVLSSNLISSIDNAVGVFQPNNNIMSTEISFRNNRAISGRFKFTLDVPIAIANTILVFTMAFSKN